MTWLEKIGISFIQHPVAAILICGLVLSSLAIAGAFAFSHYTQRKLLYVYLSAFSFAFAVGGLIGLFSIFPAVVNHFYEIKTFPVLSYSDPVKYQGYWGSFVKYRDHGVQRKELLYIKSIDVEDDFSKPNKTILKKYVVKPQYRTVGLPTGLPQTPAPVQVQDHMIINETKPLKWTKANK